MKSNFEYQRWLKVQRAFEATKKEADELSFIALAYLSDKNFTMAAKSIVEMARLYNEVYKQGGWNYCGEGFSKKVVQIISIAQGELFGLNVKSELDKELQALRDSRGMIIPTLVTKNPLIS